MKRIITFAVSILFLTGSVIGVVFTKPTTKKAVAETQGVVRLWHIDTFEGGKGSRAKFLSKVAKDYEKRHKGSYIMVNVYTPTGASVALKRGETPDMLSFSCGIDGVAEHCTSIPNRFKGGEVGGNFYAYPWCRGEYIMFSMQDDFSKVNEENVIISKGGNNLPVLAGVMSGLKGEIAVAASTTAYVQFLNGKYQYLFGTSRDIYRFQTRGVTVFTQSMPAFNDLYQYIAITTKDGKMLDFCKGFLDELLSNETQGKLNEIGMYSCKNDQSKYTLSAFIDSAGVRRLETLSVEAIKTGEIKILENYLKALN